MSDRAAGGGPLGERAANGGGRGAPALPGDGFIAPGWVLDEQGRLMRELKPHMGRRLRGWDYRRPGYYMITLVMADRREGKFGQLVVRRPTACGAGAGQMAGAADAGRVAGGAGAAGAGRLAGAAGAGRVAALVSQAPTAQAEGLAAGGRELWLSIEEARALELEPEQVEAKVIFSPLGRAIFEHFKKMGAFTPGLEPVYCAVMPDHLHLLVKIVSELARPLGNAIGGFKTGCEKIYQRAGGEGRLFAEGFVDEIILRAGQLKAEFAYLLDNPRRLAVKRLFPWLFKVSRRIRIDFRLAPKGPAGRGAAPLAPKGPAGRGGDVRPAPAAPAAGWFSAIGNHFLLARSVFHQIQVSRRFFAYARDARGRLLKDSPPAVATREFAEKLAAALAAGKGGAVLVSPCISQGEREIARQAFAAGYRVITLANKGFSPLYKPGGKLFESCAAGNLLMLAPIGWPYQPAEKPMTRVDALVLNRIAQLITGEGACTIDYKGATLAHVDEEVKKVV